MKSHVNLLGILQLTWGGMGLLLGASLLLLAGGAAAIARTPDGDPLTAGFTALLFVVFAAGAGAGRLGERVGRPGAPAASLAGPDRRAGARGHEPLRAAVRDGARDLHLLGAAAQRRARPLRGRGQRSRVRGWPDAAAAHREDVDRVSTPTWRRRSAISSASSPGSSSCSWRRRTSSSASTRCSRRCCSSGSSLIDILLQLIPILGALVVVFVVIPVSAILWLLLMYKAYQGEEFKLPLVGQMAADRT